MQRLEIPIKSDLGATTQIQLSNPCTAHLVITTAGGTVIRVPIEALGEMSFTVGHDATQTHVVISVEDRPSSGLHLVK
jgi:hypothetical protein